MASVDGRTPSWLGLPLKHLSLVTLTVQNSVLIVVMHYSRVMPLVDGTRYLTSTAVLLNEVVKLAVSVTLALYDIATSHPPGAPATMLFEQLYMSVFSRDSWQLAIPATLYTLQNSLQYVAVSNLDAVHFQILYQLKILTTALFSVTILGRTLSTRRWLALVLLTMGVAVVQLPAAGEPPLRDDDAGFWFPRSFHELGQAVDVAAELTKRSATYQGIQEDLSPTPVMSYSVGLAAVLAAAATSGLTGVYFEQLLKQNPASVWVRNVQLSFYSLFPALLAVVLKDGAAVAQHGFLGGYNAVVWAAIVCQALGGVLVALCINYADNIAKNFATSISIVISFLVTFDPHVSWTFLTGTGLVLYATYLYSAPDPHPRPQINIVEYEKTTIDRSLPLDGGLLDPRDVTTAGLSTSRPNSPKQTRRANSHVRAKREE